MKFINMNLGQFLANALKLVLSVAALITTFYAVIDFTSFLSIPHYEIKKAPIPEDPRLDTIEALLFNMFLLTFFILQHSLLAADKVKGALNNFGLQVIYRTLYVFSTSGVLLCLTKNWKPTPAVILWEINLNYRILFCLYFGIHVLAWLIIYIGNICTDVTELLGIKQVYYSIMNLPDPNLRKSKQLQRLTSHMRHPSFLAFLLIFWLHPIMSLDRFQLAIILTSYMYIAWNTDESDYLYHKSQFERKFFELDRLQQNHLR